MKKIAGLILLSAFLFTASAQTTAIVRGKIVDTASHQSLSNASVAIIDTKDSSTIASTEAAKGGTFEVKGIEEGRYRLLVTFQGYENKSSFFSVTKQTPVIDLGNIIMERKSAMLKEVIVERSPMAIKKDTVEFDQKECKFLSHVVGVTVGPTT